MRREIKSSKKYLFVFDEELNTPCAFDAFLFNDLAHLSLQPSQNRHSYYLIKKHDEIIHARCTFFIENNVAYSPYKSSFGSIEFSDKVFFQMLEEYWDNLEIDLKEKGVKEIFIKNYPVCYNPSHAQMLSFLFATKGFEIQTQELNFHINVDDQDFARKVHESERKRLNKALKKEYTYQKQEGIDVSDLYSLIDTSRKRKGYPTTMSLAGFERLTNTFPRDVLIFTVNKGNIIAAALTVIAVNKSILYTFYGADNHEYLSDSPLVMLHYHLYNYAIENCYKTIDLGIGSDTGVPNQGLIRFKEKLAGTSSLKITVSKTVNDRI